MKKKVKEEAPVAALSVGDKVLTPISDRAGEIIKIVELPIVYGHLYFTIDSLPQTRKEYTVDLRLPCLKTDSFKTISMVCIESELAKNP